MAKKKAVSKKDVTLKIDSAIADALGIDQNTDVEMYVKDQMLIITPKRQKAESRKEKTDELTKRLMDKYDPLLKKLAKT